jgi:hypothetical protein
MGEFDFGSGNGRLAPVRSQIFIHRPQISEECPAMPENARCFQPQHRVPGLRVFYFKCHVPNVPLLEGDVVHFRTGAQIMAIGMSHMSHKCHGYRQLFASLSLSFPSCLRACVPFLAQQKCVPLYKGRRMKVFGQIPAFWKRFLKIIFWKAGRWGKDAI